MNEITFIRRHLRLNRQEQLFTIIRDEKYIIHADKYEDALESLVQQINHAEGLKGVLINNGFPSHCLTDGSQNFYMAIHCMAAYIYQQESGQSDSVSFRDQLESADDEDATIYQGFYADEQLLCPRALTVHRLQWRDDEFNYLFETEGGRYQGEYDKYLFYENVLYKGVGFEDSEFKLESENV